MSCEYVCSRCSVLANVAPVCASRGVRGVCAADDGVGYRPPTHTCLPRLMRDSAQERCATKPAFSHLRRSSRLSQTSCCSYPRPDAVSDLPHVFPRLQASWLLSRSCLLDDSVLELVHNSRTLPRTGFGNFSGARAFASVVTGFGGLRIFLSVSLLRPVSPCNLLHATAYLSALATIRRSTSLEQIHFTMSMFGVTDGARMEHRQRSMYAVSNGWSKERATHACSR